MKKKVMAFGTFDILHPGHMHYLMKAKLFGDKLVVVVARDKSVKKIKNRVPLLSEKDRLAMIKQLRIVDLAVLGDKIRNKEDAFKILKKHMPDIIALGHDQWANNKKLKKWLKANKMSAKIVRIGAFKRRIFRSSKIRKFLDA